MIMNYYTLGNRKSGFTLIESLIYFSILGIILVVFGTMLFQILLGRAKTETIQEVSQNARVAMERISDRVRNAQSISGPSAGQTGSTLTLIMTDSSKNPTVFNVASELIQIKEGSTSVQNIIADEVKVTNISFTNVSHPNTPGSIRIQFTLAASTTSLWKEYIHEETFYTTATIRPR